MRDLAIDNSIGNCIHYIVKKIIFSLKMGRQSGLKHVAGSNNVKYSINSNNNINWVVLGYIFCNLYTYITHKQISTALSNLLTFWNCPMTVKYVVYRLRSRYYAICTHRKMCVVCFLEWRHVTQNNSLGRYVTCHILIQIIQYWPNGR
jgi:hypothetical protein